MTKLLASIAVCTVAQAPWVSVYSHCDQLITVARLAPSQDMGTPFGPKNV